MGAEQFARDFVREEFRWLINREAIFSAVPQPNAGAGIRCALSDRLAVAQPPRLLIDSRVVHHVEKIFAGEGEKSVSIQDVGRGLQKRIGTKPVLVDFEDQFALAAESPERRGWEARIHAASQRFRG